MEVAEFLRMMTGPPIPAEQVTAELKYLVRMGVIRKHAWEQHERDEEDRERKLNGG